jgi:hypothetical protein
MSLSSLAAATRPEKEESEVSGAKIFRNCGPLKAILIAASIAFARGEMLPVILISAPFSLAQLGAKPIGQTAPRDRIVISSSHVEEQGS